MATLSIIIPTKDREPIFRETLKRAHAAVASIDAEIIVVNDSKTQPIAVDANWQNVKVMDNTGQGVASARNLGAANAQAPLLLFLDDDMWIDVELINKALQLNQQHPQAVFNFNWEYPIALRKEIMEQPFGRFLESIGFTTMKGWCRGMEWYDDKMFETKALAGATLLISRQVYANVNGYDASFPLAGAEDHDFSVRLIKAGYKAYIYPLLKAWHNEINKTTLKGFLQRTYNNSRTRKHAVDIGYKELALTFSPIKKMAYAIIKHIEKPLLSIAGQVPNNSHFDFIYFKLCNALIGFTIYKGYNA